MTGRDSILLEVAAERRRQDQKWGEQNHPDVHKLVSENGPSFILTVHGLPPAAGAKACTDARAAVGLVSWADIATEELAEAVEAAALGDEDAVRTEVVQLAAVCVQWAEAIDRRRAAAEAEAPR